jgi:hypothetical protein
MSVARNPAAATVHRSGTHAVAFGLNPLTRVRI